MRAPTAARTTSPGGAVPGGAVPGDGGPEGSVARGGVAGGAPAGRPTRAVRLAGLWLLIAVPVGIVATGAGAAVAGRAGSAAAIVLCLAALSTATVVALRSDRRPVRVAAVALLAAAGYWFTAPFGSGPPRLTDPTMYVANALALLLGAVVLLIAVRAASGAAAGAGSGAAGWARIADSGITVATALALVSVLTRIAVIASGGPGAGFVDGGVTTLADYPRPGPPSWESSVEVWRDLLLLTGATLTYGAGAALALALGRAGWVPRWLVAASVTIGLGAAAAQVGCAALGTGPVAATVTFVLGVPFLAALLPLTLGIACAVAGRSGNGSGSTEGSAL